MTPDLTFALLFLLLAGLAVLRPWLGLLALTFVAVMHPQGWATGWLRTVPVYLILGIVVAASTAAHFVRARQLPVLFWDWRFAVAMLFGAHMALTTWLGINPWVGWEHLANIAKIVPLLVLVILLIDTREKLFLLLVTIAASVAAFVIKGGYWALITGFRERVYGPPTSEFADNNALAVGVAMAIPLIVLWLRHAEDRALRWTLRLIVVLAFAAALSSWSRGGLLSVAVVGLLLVWHSRRRWVAGALVLVGIAIAFVSFPEAWFARMQTLIAPEAEGSAAGRLQLWRIGWAYALEHPWFGSGLASWVYLTLPMGDHMAWHSAYVSIAVEHGFVGLALWGALVFGTMASLTRLIWRLPQNPEGPFWRDAAAMLRASLAGFAVGGAFLSIQYWEYLYLLIASAIVVSRLATQPRARTVQAPDARRVSRFFTFAAR